MYTYLAKGIIYTVYIIKISDSVRAPIIICAIMCKYVNIIIIQIAIPPIFMLNTEYLSITMSSNQCLETAYYICIHGVMTKSLIKHSNQDW